MVYANKEEAKRLKELGNSYFQQKNYNEAVKCFKEAIQNDPNDHVLYSNLSGSYSCLRQYTEALECANKCINLNKNWAKGYLRKGCAEHGLGELDEAKKSYLNGLEIDPNNVSLKNALEELKREYDLRAFEILRSVNSIIDRDETLRSYRNENEQYPNELVDIILKIASNPISAKYIIPALDQRLRIGVEKYLKACRGEVFCNSETDAEIKEKEEKKRKEEEKKRKEKEEEERLKNRTPEEIKGDEHKLKGNELYKEKKFEEALNEYDEAIKINPKEIIYYYNKAAVYFEMKNYEKAIEVCLYAIENRYDFKAEYVQIAKIYNRLALSYEKLKQYDKAIQAYQKSLVENNVRTTRAALKELERKKEREEREAYIDPVKAEEHKNIGNEYFKNHDYPNAKKEYDEAIKRNPHDAKLYCNRAAVWTKLLEYPSALDDVNKAIDLDPNYVKAYIRKGHIHFFKKEYYAAIEAYKKGLAIDPENQECKDGYFRCFNIAQSMNDANGCDKEYMEKVMSDPEIRKIVQDPQFMYIFNNVNEHPECVDEYLKDPVVGNALRKLMDAGLLKINYGRAPA